MSRISIFPYLRKKIDVIEGVQQRFSGLFPWMAGQMYEEKLHWLGLYLLESIRMRGNLIETYKILIGLDRVDAGRMFLMVGGVQNQESQSEDSG